MIDVVIVSMIFSINARRHCGRDAGLIGGVGIIKPEFTRRRDG